MDHIMRIRGLIKTFCVKCKDIFLGVYFHLFFQFQSVGRKTSSKKGFPNVFHHLSTQFVVAKTSWSSFEAKLSKVKAKLLSDCSVACLPFPSQKKKKKEANFLKSTFVLLALRNFFVIIKMLLWLM